MKRLKTKIKISITKKNQFVFFRIREKKKRGKLTDNKLLLRDTTYATKITSTSA